MNTTEKFCVFCSSHEDGDTLYDMSDWDGGIEFNYIRNIQYCPICGKKLNESDIRFYIPKHETIPTALRLYVGNVYVTYERIHGGFRFSIDTKDETEAMEIAKKIVQKMKLEHDESQHGVSWRTLSLEIVPQDERYKINTIID